MNQETPLVLNGILTYGGTSQNAKNAGQYSITASGLTSTNYAVSYQPGSLTIKPRTLTASLVATPQKTYDGNAKATIELNNLQLSGFAENEIVTAKNKFLPGLYNSKNVSEANVVSVALTPENFSISEGGLLSNYVLLATSAKITPASLAIQAKTVFKNYDGKPYRGADLLFTGYVNGESSDALSGKLLYDGTAEGAIYPGRYRIAASGYSSDNYILHYKPGVLSVETGYYPITPSVLSSTSGDASLKAVKQSYFLRHSDQRQEVPLQIECRQLRSGRTGSVQCLPSVSGAGHKTRLLPPVAESSSYTCFPQSQAISG